ncbi:MAG: XdhC family protein [Chloroflexota bacterium]|nr:MAG: XdhC family protein [Chloroflexota bacterium]
MSIVVHNQEVSTVKELLEEIARRRAVGEVTALATVVRTKGSTPRKAGAKMLILPDGKILGTIGGGCGEADVWSEATESIRDGVPRLVQVDLTIDTAEDTGMICGGIMDILIEPIENVDPGERRSRRVPSA